MSSVQIFFLYAENCKDCEAAKIAIRDAVAEAGIECDFKMFNSDTRVAINIAIQNNIDDIPACVIGSGVKVFQGTAFPKNEIIAAIKKAATT